MHKELHSIQLIKDYMVEKKLIKEQVNSIDEIYSFFANLASNVDGKKFNSLYILNYIYSYVACDEVAKRKTSARVFEDLLSIIFGGDVADSKKRKNINDNVPDCFNLVKDKIAGNKREKIDLIFGNYGVSVKTLMDNNKEINLGSFERKVLFDGFGVSDYLTERKGKDGIGLGSKPQLKLLFEKIKINGHYASFVSRFKEMYQFIFSDDMILAIKNNTKLELYFFKGTEFSDLLTSKLDNVNNLLTILNRWEGNSIRVDRSELIKSATRKIILDFEILNSTVIKSINDLDFKLHKMYVEYFNQDNKMASSRMKNELIDTLDKLFEEFKNNFETLA